MTTSITRGKPSPLFREAEEWAHQIVVNVFRPVVTAWKAHSAPVPLPSNPATAKGESTEEAAIWPDSIADLNPQQRAQLTSWIDQVVERADRRLQAELEAQKAAR